MREKVFTKSVRVLIVMVFLEAAVLRGTPSHIMILCTATGWLAFVCGHWLRGRKLNQRKQTQSQRIVVEHIIHFSQSRNAVMPMQRSRDEDMPAQVDLQRRLPVRSRVPIQRPRDDVATWFQLAGKDQLFTVLSNLKNEGQRELVVTSSGVMYAVKGNYLVDQGTWFEMPKEEEWYILFPLLADMGIQVRKENHQLYLAW